MVDVVMEDFQLMHMVYILPEQPLGLNGEPLLECIPCNCRFKHLIKSADVTDVAQSFYQVPSLYDLFFTTVKADVILDFFKALTQI